MTIVEKISSRIPQPLRRSIAPALEQLQALRRGTLAVPAEEGGPALPLRTNRLSFSHSEAVPLCRQSLRDSRLLELGNSEATFHCRTGHQRAEGPMSEPDSLSSSSFLINLRPPVSTSRVFARPQITEVETPLCFLIFRPTPSGERSRKAREVACYGSTGGDSA